MRSTSHLFYSTWKILVMLSVIFTAISLPIELSFHHHIFGFENSRWIVALIFLIDLFININRIKNEKKRIKCDDIENKEWYRTSVIFADAIAALPLDLFFPLPVFRLLRLFKVLRLHHIVVGYQHTMIKHAGSFVFIVFIFWLTLAINALACGWHALLNTHYHSDFTSDYINSVYWTITTVTTVGYGDITPETNAQKLYAIFVQLLGYGVFTYMIGSVASRLLRKDPARVRFEDNVDGLVSLLHFKSLPAPLRNKIMDYYKYMWRNRLGYDETAFLESLPNNLQQEVALHLKREIIDKVSLFKDASETFKREIALMLKSVFITPNNYVCKAGEQANSMYFVVKGELMTLSADEKRQLTQIKTGDYFGEIALLKNKTRSATIKALSYCDLYALDKESFDQVIIKYPHIEKMIREIVEKREQNYHG
ncbi:cyclic nucleotide-binding domain-containing protein [Carboxylicivirga sp. RSCT41]|uniref:cyclic nucleotide-gated ion channel n=1 Tax=Carboxylicivirga agarovorans TaxID=3417570 RepID=UPI003D32F73E